MEKIDSEASEWYTLTQSISMTEFEKQQFSNWLKSNDAHQKVHQHYEMIWRDLAIIVKSAEAAALKKNIQQSLLESSRRLIKTQQRIFYRHNYPSRQERSLPRWVLYFLRSLVY